MMGVFRCDAKYKNFQDFLKHTGLDAVAIFTPVPMHAWMAVEAMRAGKNVISAVVAAMSEEQLVEMLETFRTPAVTQQKLSQAMARAQLILLGGFAGPHQITQRFMSGVRYHTAVNSPAR